MVVEIGQKSPRSKEKGEKRSEKPSSADEKLECV
jgi:hypothetical protein